MPRTARSACGRSRTGRPGAITARRSGRPPAACWSTGRPSTRKMTSPGRNRGHRQRLQAAGTGPPPQLVEKASQSSRPQARSQFGSVFPGDLCIGENTAQAANVRVVRRRRQTPARQTASFSKKWLCHFSTISGGRADPPPSQCPEA